MLSEIDNLQSVSPGTTIELSRRNWGSKTKYQLARLRLNSRWLRANTFSSGHALFTPPPLLLSSLLPPSGYYSYQDSAWLVVSVIVTASRALCDAEASSSQSYIYKTTTSSSSSSDNNMLDLNHWAACWVQSCDEM